MGEYRATTFSFDVIIKDMRDDLLNETVDTMLKDVIQGALIDAISQVSNVGWTKYVEQSSVEYSKEEMIERWRAYKGVPQELELPSAPKNFIQYFEEENRPQPKLDVDYENGMGVSLSRLRDDTLFDYKFVGLSHNTVRGAAGGAILLAELLTAKEYITAK